MFNNKSALQGNINFCIIIQIHNLWDRFVFGSLLARDWFAVLKRPFQEKYTVFIQDNA